MRGNSKRKYYTELYRTRTDYNDCNGAPFSNENIRDAIYIVNAEEESEAHNLCIDAFCRSPVITNTQGENENVILTSERINKSDALAETLKVLTINDAGYYNSEGNHAEGDHASDSKVATHTSNIKKRKVTDTSNGNLQQNIIDQPDTPDHHHDN